MGNERSKARYLANKEARDAELKMAQQKIVGLFSIDRKGNFCFHQGNDTSMAEAERVRKLLNRSVTGGPYKVMVAVAIPVSAGVEGPEHG